MAVKGQALSITTEIHGITLHMPVGIVWFNDDGTIQSISVKHPDEVNRSIDEFCGRPPLVPHELPNTYLKASLTEARLEAQRIEDYQEPTDREVQAALPGGSHDWWHTRNMLREEKNGPPPVGSATWGDFWKKR